MLFCCGGGTGADSTALCSDGAPASGEHNFSIAMCAERICMTANGTCARGDAVAIDGAPGPHPQDAAGVHAWHVNLLTPHIQIC